MMMPNGYILVVGNSVMLSNGCKHRCYHLLPEVLDIILMSDSII